MWMNVNWLKARDGHKMQYLLDSVESEELNGRLSEQFDLLSKASDQQAAHRKLQTLFIMLNCVAQKKGAMSQLTSEDAREICKAWLDGKFEAFEAKRKGGLFRKAKLLARNLVDHSQLREVPVFNVCGVTIKPDSKKHSPTVPSIGSVPFGQYTAKSVVGHSITVLTEGDIRLTHSEGSERHEAVVSLSLGGHCSETRDYTKNDYLANAALHLVPVAAGQEEALKRLCEHFFHQPTLENLKELSPSLVDGKSDAEIHSLLKVAEVACREISVALEGNLAYGHCKSGKDRTGLMEYVKFTILSNYAPRAKEQYTLLPFLSSAKPKHLAQAQKTLREAANVVEALQGAPDPTSSNSAVNAVDRLLKNAGFQPRSNSFSKLEKLVHTSYQGYWQGVDMDTHQTSRVHPFAGLLERNAIVESANAMRKAAVAKGLEYEGHNDPVYGMSNVCGIKGMSGYPSGGVMDNFLRVVATGSFPMAGLRQRLNSLFSRARDFFVSTPRQASDSGGHGTKKGSTAQSPATVAAVHVTASKITADPGAINRIQKCFGALCTGSGRVFPTLTTMRGAQSSEHRSVANSVYAERKAVQRSYSDVSDTPRHSSPIVSHSGSTIFFHKKISIRSSGVRKRSFTI